MNIFYIKILFFSILLITINYNLNNIYILNECTNSNFNNTITDNNYKNENNKNNNSFKHLKTNGLNIRYDKKQDRFISTNNLDKYSYRYTFFFQKKDRFFHYQKYMKTILIPLYIFGFEPYKSLPVDKEGYKIVRFDRSLKDDWKQYYNLQMHQYDIEQYFIHIQKNIITFLIQIMLQYLNI